MWRPQGLRQAPYTLRSTGFDVHQDTEDYDFIEFTVVVKLTKDVAGEPPSAMRVVGGARHFDYGPAAGDAGCFRARVHHASVPPRSTRPHLKMAFFFKRSEKGERRAKRALGASDEHGEEELAMRRRQVTHQMEASALDAGQLESIAAFGVDTAARDRNPDRPAVVERCGECDGCQRFKDRRCGTVDPALDDCGKCCFCRDKPKFGGKDKWKQVCKTRWC